MKFRIVSLFSAILCLAGFSSPAQERSYAKLVAETAIKTLWKDSTEDAPHPKKWTYDQAVVLLGIEGLWYRTADPAYFDYMQKSMDRFIKEDGAIDTYNESDFNIDNIACGRILLALYQVTGKDKYFKAARTLRDQLNSQPRTQEGSFWHKKVYPNQVWLDGLYMAQPFYAEWAATFGEGDKSFDDIANQFIFIEQHTRDKSTGLMRHAWDESRKMAWADSTTGLAPNVWARAMGWYGAALVDALEYFPADYAKRKQLTDILNRYATAIAKAQDKGSGLWWDVMNAPYPVKKGNYFEASAACQFVYVLAKGVRLGVLDESFLATAKKGYAGILKQFIVQGTDGLTHLNGTVSVSGLGGKPFRDGSFEYYISEKVVQDDAKGVGAFIQASNEMEILPGASKGNGKTVLLDSYFNNEHDKDAFGNPRSVHYKWDERSNGGFQFWKKMLQRAGATPVTTYSPPSPSILKNINTYVIVDPDIPKENPDAKYMDEQSAQTIYDWVKAGGTLVLLLNDTGNCDLTHMNLLTQKFGFTFNSDSRNHVAGKQFEQGALFIKAANPIFKTARKVYLKEISTIKITNPATAKSVYTDGGDVLMVTAKAGKGKVFAVGDPWIYNEYVDGRKLPADFDNFKALQDITDWMLSR